MQRVHSQEHATFALLLFSGERNQHSGCLGICRHTVRSLYLLKLNTGSFLHSEVSGKACFTNNEQQHSNIADIKPHLFSCNWQSQTIYVSRFRASVLQWHKYITRLCHWCVCTHCTFEDVTSITVRYFRDWHSDNMELKKITLWCTDQTHPNVTENTQIATYWNNARNVSHTCPLSWVTGGPRAACSTGVQSDFAAANDKKRCYTV